VSQAIGWEIPVQSAPEEAVSRVTEALKGEGFGVLTRIDVREALKEKLGVEFRPYVILGACNPQLAHRALSRRAEVGLLLPCNVTVESRAEGGSWVRIADPEVLLSVGDLGRDPALREVAQEARRRLNRVAEALARPD